MNKIDYNQSGGFPLSTQVLDAAQEAYKNFNAFGNFAGDLAIITGCQDSTGGTVTDGFVAIYGELIPFVGTTKTANVVIVETGDQRGFEDGSVKSVIYSRYATFGEGPVTYPWADFRRPMTLFALEDRLLQLEKAVPVGLVAIWDRPEDEIPTGWVEHTDLAGRTAVGHQTGDVNFGALGGNLGAAQVTIETGNLPPLSVNIPIAPNGDNPGDNMYGRAGVATNRSFTVKAGPATPMSNVQPSRIVKFIRFVGFN
ncbi:MAG: hypothetical protein L6264_07255 [Weeksellaceae bacterium]|nr:hypothetical protein [Bacteroidota bacterium]MCG2780730.1 hypothetical protein [Weeksellaceae bacterium]